MYLGRYDPHCCRIQLELSFIRVHERKVSYFESLFTLYLNISSCIFHNEVDIEISTQIRRIAR